MFQQQTLLPVPADARNDAFNLGWCQGRPTSRVVGERLNSTQGGHRRNRCICPLAVIHRRQSNRLAGVESGCGAVAVGRACLFPPLSSGGALVARPWLRFHTPSRRPHVRIGASGSRTRSHPFVHDTSCPTRLRHTSQVQRLGVVFARLTQP